jgi:integrase/recombinase XerC/integrase/recombinase XerD
VEDGTLDTSPLRTMRPPVHRDDQIQPFTTDQVQALLKAVRTTRYARRDEALILLLLDTGARAAEVCGLKVGDFSIRDRSVRVRGKGDTHRVLFLTSTTTRAILHYLRDQRRGEDDPLFVSEKPSCAGEGLTPHGLGQVIKRVGAAAGIEGVRCSPHTFRHTFAVEFLRNGGDPLTLQSLYGHTSLEMTRRYVLFSQADRKRKHGQFSPVAHLKRPR